MGFLLGYVLGAYGPRLLAALAAALAELVDEDDGRADPFEPIAP